MSSGGRGSSEGLLDWRVSSREQLALSKSGEWGDQAWRPSDCEWDLVGSSGEKPKWVGRR